MTILREVLGAALDSIVMLDEHGRITGLNPLAERCFGPDAVGRELADLLAGPPAVPGRRVESVARRADGSEFPVELTVARIAVEGEPLVLANLRDITERRRAESELRASRARIVSAADAARRRIERDLHDGAQQRLVSLALQLRHARNTLDPDVLDAAIGELAAATAELRELARGIHPAVLSEGGLEPALAGLAGRVALPVILAGPPAERLPAAVEATAYFVVAEALTNVVRHAHATRVEIAVLRHGDTLVVEVRDDGRGGAAATGSGLSGLADRVTALDGRFAVESGAGTTVRAELPCAS